MLQEGVGVAGAACSLGVSGFAVPAPTIPVPLWENQAWE